MQLYIPLCFLLIGAGTAREGRVIVLYIPLCFLLIQEAIERIYSKLTLHSTMFPINRKYDFREGWAEELYIPLCFLLILLYRPWSHSQ